jgi:ABC-2 type transport system permease protein
LTMDVSQTPRVPFGRLIGVELRKMADTRAGMWLLLTIVILTAAFVAIFFFAADPSDRTLVSFLGVTATPQGFLLPVLGILLVTGEWGQRTTLTTFTLEPSRGRVVAAKVVAAAVFGLVAIAVAMALAAAAAAVGGATDPFAGIGAEDVGRFTLLQTLGILQGLAFGLLLLNSAAAIVVYFVIPIAFNVLVNVVSWLADAAPWVDLATAQVPLFGSDPLTGEEWAHLASTTAIWIVVPFVLGMLRVLRTELK